MLAANPCPCATAAGDTACTCSPLERRRYQSRLSGPLLDRIDLRVDLPRGHPRGLAGRARRRRRPRRVVARAGRGGPGRRRRTGWPAPGCRSTARCPGRLLRERWAVPRASLRLAERALERGALSVRGFDRVLRVAWTLADLAGRTVPGADEVAEALGMRLQRAAA